MFLFTRSVGQEIVVNGVRLTVVAIKGKRVRLKATPVRATLPRPRKRRSGLRHRVVKGFSVALGAMEQTHVLLPMTKPYYRTQAVVD